MTATAAPRALTSLPNEVLYASWVIYFSVHRFRDQRLCRFILEVLRLRLVLVRAGGAERCGRVGLLPERMSDHFLCLGKAFTCLRWCVDEGSVAISGTLRRVILTWSRPVRVRDTCLVARLHLRLDFRVLDPTGAVLATLIVH